MNRNTWKLIASLPVAAMLAVVLTGSIARADVDDAWLTSRVKLSMLTAQDMRGNHIDVDVDHGIVTLSGSVRSDAERDRAEVIASRTGGVRSVRNDLRVADDDAWRTPDVSDERLKSHVRDALHHAHLRDQHDTRIEVKSVHNGVVRLGGRAGSIDDQLRAVQVASNVSGVRGVVNDIHAPDHVAGWDTSYHRAPSRSHDDVDRYDARTGGTSNDAWIMGQIRSRYMANSSFPSGAIDVDCRDGVVILSGTVSDRDAAEEAVRIARSVSGVRSVRDQLTISGTSYGGGDQPSDGELEQAIRSRIEQAELDADIRVQVRDGVAYLSGYYDRAEDRYEAVRIARGMSGVVRVQDDLKPVPRD
jgi:hyperosmotically inducible protein